ncbi:hypothetical protein HZ989_07725 [Brevundimonas sp. AJA228-03]|uniref:hypothetical protein n=1 Tax=Brevundimonas sp. AJA228-03 TaxID=2752515 RepID=UPI001AE09737|nr:hypothetical protein [Brevundimonas sp. AJA228-03]QTN18189.1 hypothetical protein HZ989_07725 [Brevundimonas sp. AJA228-03]
MTTSLDLTLGDALLARVRAAAAEAGMSPEAWVAVVITDTLARQGVSEDAAPFDAAGEDPVMLDTRTPETVAFQHAAALAAIEEYDRTGVSHSIEDVMAELRADLEARLAAKA